MVKTHYSAFISYRHITPDQEIAEKLHRLIEHYTVPKALRAEPGKRHLDKVFRDQEELPLSPDLGRDIETALDNSDYLICVCTPRYPESRWCMREVEYFIAKHGRERVLALLAEGEPADSFPELLRFAQSPDHTRIEMEPLAADVRGKTLHEHLKKLRREKLRILAPMLGTSFDGLYQRARRRRLRNGLAAALAGLVLAGGFLAYALVQNGRLAAERETAARNEMDLLLEKSLSRTAENRKQEARDLALAARSLSLTLDGYGEDRVRDALAVTCYAGDFAVQTELNIPGVYAEFYRFSPDGKKIAAVVSSTAVFCYDAVTGEEMWSSTPVDMMLTSLEWKPDGSALAATSMTGHQAAVLDGADGHIIASLPYDWACGARFAGDKVLVSGAAGIAVWNPAVEAEQIPLVCKAEEPGQNIVTLIPRNSPFLVRVDYFGGIIQVADIANNRAGFLKLPDPRVIQAAAPSPDGSQLYVRQGSLLTLFNMVTDEVIWSREAEGMGGAGISLVGEAVWAGSRIFDTGTVLDAATGETVAQIGEASAEVSPDGSYFLCANGIYRTEDGSLYCRTPGELLAVDPTGESLLIRRDLPSRDLMPGHGSTRRLDSYSGTLLDVPDWTLPPEGRLTEGLSDPVMWGSTDNAFTNRLLVSPDGRFCVQINAANHVKIYDLDIGNEPAHRIYGYPTNGIGTNIGDASFSADSRLLALAGEMGQMGVYELESGRLLQFWDGLYGKLSLEGIRFNGDGTLVMAAGYMNQRFRICSVENGLVLYDLYPEKAVAAWGFDTETGDAVILYEDGSALCADIFTSAEELYAYAGE